MAPDDYNFPWIFNDGGKQKISYLSIWDPHDLCGVLQRKKNRNGQVHETYAYERYAGKYKEKKNPKLSSEYNARNGTRINHMLDI